MVFQYLQLKSSNYTKNLHKKEEVQGTSSLAYFFLRRSSPLRS